MHEMTILGNVMDIVLDHAAEANATKVVRVSLVVGELRDVVDELMESCFHFLARDTVAADAQLEMVKVPFKVACKECGNIYAANIHDSETLTCPECGSSEIDIHSGREFFISGIEIL